MREPFQSLNDASLMIVACVQQVEDPFGEECRVLLRAFDYLHKQFMEELLKIEAMTSTNQ